MIFVEERGQCGGVNTSKRKTHGEFALTSEPSNARYKNYFRLSRDQFADVYLDVHINGKLNLQVVFAIFIQQ